MFRACLKANKKAILIADRLIVDNEVYTLEDLNRINIDGIDIQSLATRTDGKTLAFGWLSILSNFYPCSISDQGRSYGSSEHVYQHRKGRFSGDELAAAKIYAAEDPIDQKQIADRLGMKCKDWPVRESMYKSVSAKFRQNADLGEYLLSTGDLVLVEANMHDTDWAVGLSLRDANIFNQSQWKGGNMLGEVLMTVRRQLEMVNVVSVVRPVKSEEKKSRLILNIFVFIF